MCTLNRARALPSDIWPAIGFHAIGIVAAAGLLWLAAPVGDWEPLWLVVGVLVLAPLGELSARRHDARVRVSPTELIVVPAMVLLGPLPAAAASALTTITDIARGTPHCGRWAQVTELWVHLTWPAVGSLAFFAVSDGGLDPASPQFLAATAAAAAIGMATNVGLVHLGQLAVPARRRAHAGEPAFSMSTLALFNAPVLVASIGIVAAYGLGGPSALALVVAALFMFHRLIDQLLLLRHREQELEMRNRQLATFHLGVLGLLTTTLARRDRLTARHSAAVSRWARDLAEDFGCNAEARWAIRTAGLLHDIGKFVLPDALLYHDGELSEPERRRFTKHAKEGADLVGRIAGLQPVADLIRHHHERFDGTGYPGRLAREQIPLGSRILAICESYDAMTARDSYRIPIAPSEAIAELRACAGSSFDPALVERFVGLLEKGAPAYGHGEAVDFELELDHVMGEDRSTVPPSKSLRRALGRGDTRHVGHPAHPGRPAGTRR